MSLNKQKEFQQFTDEEMWILKAAIEGLWDYQKSCPSRFRDETVEQSRKLMMKVWKILDEQYEELV